MATVVAGRRLLALFGLAAMLFTASMLVGSAQLAAAAFLLLGIALCVPRLARRLRLEATVRLAAPTAVEEDPYRVEVDVANPGRTSVLADIRTVLPPHTTVAGSSAAHRHLPPGSRETMGLEVTFGLFGLQRIGPVQARVEDAFALAAVEHNLAPAVDLRVYPRRHPMRDTVFRAKQIRNVLGLYDVPQPGNSFEFYGLRGYSPGDRPRDVNWKASARVGSLVVNQHQKESDAEIVLLVDARAVTLVGSAKQSPFAQACRAALTVGEAHLRARDAVKFVAYGEDLHQDRHTGATRRVQGLLDLVVGLEPAGAMTLGNVVQRILPSLKRRSPVMVFSPLVGDDTIEAAVSTLQSHGLPVAVLVPRAHWPSGRGDAGTGWDAAQKLRIRSLRRLGVAVADHGAGAHLAASLESLEVRA